MGGSKHKQTKKKPAKVVRESKKKKDLSGEEKEQADHSLERDSGHNCCLPVGKFDFTCAPFSKCLAFPFFRPVSLPQSRGLS